MGKPWIWNLALVAALIVTGTGLVRALRESTPPFPPPPEFHREQSPRVFLPRGNSDKSYEIIATRNLFSTTRGVHAPAKEEPEKPPVARKVPVKNITLYGVVLEEDGARYAFLEAEPGKGGGRPEKIQEGGSFSGGTVKSIEPDRVILQFGDEEYTVALRSPKNIPDSPTRAAGQPPLLPESPSSRRTPELPRRAAPSGLSRAPGRRGPAEARLHPGLPERRERAAPQVPPSFPDLQAPPELPDFVQFPGSPPELPPSIRSRAEELRQNH